MDIALVSVTAISLSMAFAMGIVAWRVIREERRRSDARVAALIAELDRTRGTNAGLPSQPRSRALDTRCGSDVSDNDPARPDPPPVTEPRAPLLGAVAGPSGWGRPILAAVAAGLVVVAVATIAMGPARRRSTRDVRTVHAGGATLAGARQTG